MALPFMSPDEAQDRLHQSVIFYNNEPIYVHSMMGPNIVYYPLPMRAGRAKMVSWQDPGFEAQSISLGYLNNEPTSLTKPDAYYVTRNPQRQWRQGLVAGTLRLPEWDSWGNMLSSNYLRDMLMNKYPPYDEAMNLLETHRGRSIAFHKKFAIQYGNAGAHYLCYRGQKCASTMDGRTFKLGADYQHLREQMQELGIQLM